ncbi:major facilitator superfamily domain-containing protein [Xylaria arbuscula]|nr:major facilitator superfamily domain-containing protein [Xylaria arbuscula]
MTNEQGPESGNGREFKSGFRLWVIIVGLSITALLAALQQTALGADFIWTTNAFFIAGGICVGARNGTMLIAGQTVHRVGSGGIILINTLGPFIGGAIINSTTWRGVFYINFPIGGMSLIVMFLLLHLWRTLVPLLLGFFGFFFFAGFEASSLPQEPVAPVKLFAHRTSIIVLINTFLNSILNFWFLFFLPVYYQSVVLYSPSRTGYLLLPQSVADIPGAAIAAIAISKSGKFVPVHFAGFAVQTLSFSLLSLCPRGRGRPIRSHFSLKFTRAFGSILGIAIPAATFNNPIDQLLNTISDTRARELMAGGGAYQDASAAFVRRFAPLRVFLVGLAYFGLATLLALLEREVALREHLETNYGSEEKDDAITDSQYSGKK